MKIRKDRKIKAIWIYRNDTDSIVPHKQIFEKLPYVGYSQDSFKYAIQGLKVWGSKIAIEYEPEPTLKYIQSVGRGNIVAPKPVIIDHCKMVRTWSDLVKTELEKNNRSYELFLRLRADDNKLMYALKQSAENNKTFCFVYFGTVYKLTATSIGYLVTQSQNDAFYYNAFWTY